MFGETRKNTITVTFDVNPEMIPGWGCDPVDFLSSVTEHIKRAFASYDPVITTERAEPWFTKPEPAPKTIPSNPCPIPPDGSVIDPKRPH
ncbi:hypothetical protein KAR91_61845 [Candidatus Pacearchaeota archaeon]|nr:hypothetical protein [Candidatus Pacearchaeota archaeon]